MRHIAGLKLKIVRGFRSSGEFTDTIGMEGQIGVVISDMENRLELTSGYMGDLWVMFPGNIKKIVSIPENPYGEAIWITDEEEIKEETKPIEISVAPHISLDHIKGFKKEILDCLLTTPENLPLLKNTCLNRGYYDKVINQLFPYKVGIEIECLKSLSRIMFPNIRYDKAWLQIKSILGCEQYSDNSESDIERLNEHRMCFRGHKQVIALYKLCNLLQEHCILATNGGIHYHFDFPEFKQYNNEKDWEEVEKVVKKYLNQMNEICHYTGKYNKKGVSSIEKGWWVCLRNNDNLTTIEIRIGMPKFDYQSILLEIINLSQIITKIRSELKYKQYRLK